MAQAKLSLSWDVYQKNICNGLSLLQQRGEFVDMTLAADGHHVKVHQMVLALVSPYIKDLISSAPCPHPVIFLNNVSYTTLCEILEYVYTGEVLVAKESLSDLIAAGKALHINGLKDMHEQDHSISKPKDLRDNDNVQPSQSLLVEKLKEHKEMKSSTVNQTPVQPMCKVYVDDIDNDADVIIDNSTDNSDTTKDDVTKYDDKSKSNKSNTNVQFTVTPQGNLQIINNRYMYNLRYVQKNRVRLWRCVDYSATKCPARLFTNENNVAVKRIDNHTHAFHDNKILKKHRQGMIYSACEDAENKAQATKDQRNHHFTVDML